MIRTHTNSYLTSAWLGCDKPRVEAVRESRVERYIKIPMPWTRMMYTISYDDFRRQRPVFAIFWYRNPGYISLRMGWSCQDP